MANLFQCFIFLGERIYFVKGIKCRSYCKQYLQNFQYCMDTRELKFLFIIYKGLRKCAASYICIELDIVAV